MPLDSAASIEALRRIRDNAERRLVAATETFRLACVALAELDARMKANGVPAKGSEEYHANIRIIDAFDSAREARHEAQLAACAAAADVDAEECRLVGIEVRR